MNSIKTAVLFLGIVFLVLACDLHSREVPVPPTADQDESIPSETITVGGKSRQIHLRRFGDPSNPVFMISPGSLSDLRAYLPFQVFSDRYHVVLWDQRGCGLSERVGTEELSPELMAEEIHQVKLLVSPQNPVTVAGHSWSANFTAMYLGRYPDEVTQAVLIEPPGLKSEYMFGLETVLNLTSVGYADMNWFTGILSPSDHASLDFSMLAILDSGVRDFFVDRNNKPAWPVWRVGGLALIVWERSVLDSAGGWNFDHTRGLEDFTKPVLLVGSSHSPIGFSFQKKYNAQAFPSAEVLFIDQAGHRILTEQWEALETGLKKYLALYGGTGL